MNKNSGIIRAFFGVAQLLRTRLELLLTAFDRWRNAPRLSRLEAGVFYGLEGSVPFVDQLAGLDSSQIEREYGKILDKAAAQRFGAPHLKEFSFWAWRSCGIANVAMVLRSEDLYEDDLYQLVCEGIRADGYAFRNFYGKEDIGWKHQALVKLLRGYGMCAKTRTHLSMAGLLSLVASKRYVIVSVRSPRGGHMVLVKGFTCKSNGDHQLLVNDPYLFGERGGENKLWSLGSFRDKYLGRAVVSWSPNDKRWGRI